MQDGLQTCFVAKYDAAQSEYEGNMESEMKFDHLATGMVEKARDIMFQGRFKVEHFDAAGVKIGDYELQNGVVNQGKNSVLDIMFHGSTQITTWYIGLMDNSGYTAEAAADTLASHAGWNEFTSYTGDRKEWTEGAASSQSITNGTTVDFAITGSGTLKGLFLCSVASGTSGTLWATAAFSSTVSVANGDTLKVTYTVSC